MSWHGELSLNVGIKFLPSSGYVFLSSRKNFSSYEFNIFYGFIYIIYIPIISVGIIKKW